MKAATSAIPKLHNDENSPKICLVTGAAGGIGKATAELLEENGYRVIRWDLQHAPNCIPIDVTDAAAVADGFATIVEEEGCLDALVHASGALVPDTAMDPSSGALQACFEVNFFGTVNVCSQAARIMARHGGAIVGVTSNSAAVPRIGMGSYGASKAAAESWLRTLALDCAPHGVRCNIVSPGSTDTPMLRNMFNGEDFTEPLVKGDAENYKMGIPLGRVADPVDVAQACAFLLSPAARHITMHDLRVDGGATLDA
nr:SDR family oxidoreductase [Corynebacterium sp. TAE3-ERU12]